jgi:cephalosporin hydroxylase
VPDYDRSIEEERSRRHEAEELLAAVVNSRFVRPVEWLHRLTRRGPDVAAARAFLAESPVAERDRRQSLVDDFHRLYYDSRESTWQNTRWMGSDVLKLPLDLWLYQEYLYDLRPDVIVECGTFMGGSALFMAHMLDIIGHGEIISIDLTDRDGRPQHPRISYISGSSTDPAVVAGIEERVAGKKSVVILDSDHSEGNVYAELQVYAPLVSVGSLLIVEDTNVNGHPVYPEFGPGPMEALDRFLAENDDYAHDPQAHKFLMTFNPRGVLRRLR